MAELAASVTNLSNTLARFIRESPIALTLASPSFDDMPLVLANRAFSELTGYASEDVIGRNCRFLQGPATEETARAEMRQAIAQGRETVVPVTNYRRDGSRFRNLVFIFPIFDAGGQLLYVMGSQYDISAPRRTVSPREYGDILEETINLSNPHLSNNDNVRIATQSRLAEVVAQVLAESR